MKQAKPKDLVNKSLDTWFRRLQPSDFDNLKTNYVARYIALDDFLVKEVHPLVAVGTAVADGMFLNDHGPAHVTAVMKRASELLAAGTDPISAYETYILLAAIQLHDIGNLFGRLGHEARLPELEGRLEALLGDDSAEKRLLRAIATAHGGSKHGDLDTIRQLIEAPVLNQAVRVRFLAGLLRLADELADDSQRISHFAIQNHVVNESSRLFHRYSASLQSVIIDPQGHSIDLHYELTKEDVEEVFTKAAGKCYLIDEIMSRNVKMHRERMYCMRFLLPAIKIDSINVKINVFESKRSPDQLFVIGYRLEDKGYPSLPLQGIYDLCPELMTWS